MGTRSLTRVIKDGKHIINMYRQFDGYPSGHGKELAAFLSGKPIINGYQSEGQKAFNGAGCLAAQMVAKFKKGIGEVYLNPIEETDCWQDYEYILRVDNLVLTIQVIGCHNFSGTLDEFAAWCVSELND
jgi:hypothetical protein